MEITGVVTVAAAGLAAAVGAWATAAKMVGASRLHAFVGVIEAAPDAVVVYAAAPGADLSTRLLGACGVVYVEGRVSLPSGDWSAANSRVTAHARTLEAIEFVRAERAAA